MNEITPSALLPRNDGDFRILCDEILGSSPRMTAKRKSGDDTEHARWTIFTEIAPSALLPRNDGDFRIP